MKIKTAIFASALAILASGCNTFRASQDNLFLDEEGNVLTVTYGRLDKKHKSVFKSPVPGDGREFETESNLAVKVTLPGPNGKNLKLYECINLLPTGTMYMTDDTEWLYLANGFSCTVYKKNQDGSDYDTWYQGILCERPSARKIK